MDITRIPSFILPALMLIAISIGAKFLTVYISSRSQGFPAKASLKAAFWTFIFWRRTGASSRQRRSRRGNYEFICAANGRSYDHNYNFLTPYLIKIGWKVVENRGSGDKGLKSD
jgi:CPA2 family monovalent cation:H+ antiporter-2